MKVHTEIRHSYKRLLNGMYQEFIIRLLHFDDDGGNRTTKQDKIIAGDLYKEITQYDLGNVYGEVKIYDQQQEREIHLIKVNQRTFQ